MTRADYLERIEDADAQLVARVRELRDQVESQLAAVRARRVAQQEAFNDKRVDDARAESRPCGRMRRTTRPRRERACGPGGARRPLRSQVDDWTAQVQELERVSEAQAQERVGDWFGDWAIPTSIVMCESGGSFDAVNPKSGAAWARTRSCPRPGTRMAGRACRITPPQAQHDIAAQIWQDSGGSAWVCRIALFVGRSVVVPSRPALADGAHRLPQAPRWSARRPGLRQRPRVAWPQCR